MLALLVDLIVLCRFFFLVFGVCICLLLHIAGNVALHACRAAGIGGVADVALRDVLLAAYDARIVDHRRKSLPIGQTIVKVQFYADARESTPLTKRLIEQGLYLLFDIILYFARHVELRERLDPDRVLILIVRVVQNLARVVNNRDVLGHQSLYAVRGKVDNTLDLFLGQLRIRLETQHNRSRCRLLLFFVEAVLRQNDMNAGLLDGLNLFNRTRQLALEGLKVIDAVLELRDAEFAVIEYLKTLVPARQSLRGKIKPRLMDVRRRNKDGCA